MRCALVRDGVVVNVIVANSSFIETVASEYDEVIENPVGCETGCTWDGSSFTFPYSGSAGQNNNHGLHIVSRLLDENESESVEENQILLVHEDTGVELLGDLDISGEIVGYEA